MNKNTRLGNTIGAITLALAAVALFCVGIVAGRPVFLLSAAPIIVAGVTMFATRPAAARQAVAQQ